MEDRHVQRMDRGLVLREIIESELKCGRLDHATLQRLEHLHAVGGNVRWLNCKQQFDRARKQRFPWIMSPRAWWIRMKRNHHARNLGWLKSRTLRKIKGHGSVREVAALAVGHEAV